MTLPGGLVVREQAMALVRNLEGRGLTLSVNNGSDELIITPVGLLTDTEHREIEQLKPDLLKIVVHQTLREP